MKEHFQNFTYEIIRQQVIDKKWEDFREVLKEVWHNPPKEELDELLKFLIKNWTTVQSTKVENYYAQFILTNLSQADELGITEALAFDLAQSIQFLADNGDSHTLGYSLALQLYPDSDKILIEMIMAGEELDGYYYEDAFVRAASSANMDRNHVLRALEALSTYNFYYWMGEKEDGFNYTIRAIKAFVKKTDLKFLHLEQASEIVKDFWQLPEEEEWKQINELLST